MSEIINRIIQYDKDFAEAKFKSKVSNTFIQIKLAITSGNIEKVKHFVDDKVYEKILQKVNEDNSNNRIQIYDELNVSDIQIISAEEEDDRFVIDVILHSKVIEYYIDKESRKYLSGNNKRRIEKDVKLVFEKNKNTKKFQKARSCPTCGANIDVNSNGKCSYCNSIFDLENYDWIITEMDI